MNSEALQSGDSGIGELTPAQIAAIKKVAELADEIVSDYSEVADDYRAGLTQREIALKHSLHKGVTVGIARRAVGEALQTLISDKDELKKLSKAKMVQTSRKNGRKAYQKRIGLYSASSEQRREWRIKGGQTNRDNNSGFLALTKEERIQNGKHTVERKTVEEMRQWVRKGVVAQGKTPWITDLVEPISGLNEIDYLLNLTKNPEYIIQKSRNKGCNDNVKTAAKLNEVFHQGRQVRTPSAIATQLSEFKRNESQKSQ